MVYSILVVLFALCICVAFSLALHGCDEKTKIRVLRVVVVFYCLFGIFRYFLADAFDDEVLNGADLFGSFTRWGYYLGYVILPMSIFFERRLYRNVAICFSLPVALVCAFGISTYVPYFVNVDVGSISMSSELRISMHIFELAFAVAIPLLLLFVTRYRVTRRDLLSLLTVIPMLLVVMPAYIPQSIFGLTDFDYSTFGPFHLSWIVFLFIYPVVICRIFRKRSHEEKYELLVFWSIAQIFHTMSVFLRDFTYSRMPLQLCCIAAFFYLYTVITKSRRFFNFCYLANIVGATVAIAIASFTEPAFEFWDIHYIQEHTFVITMPIIAVSLGVFPRIGIGARRDTMRIFNVYFLFCFVVGVAINLISGGFAVNYFYMLNLNTALDYVPFATFTGLIEIPIGSTTLYPILVVTVYTVYVLLFNLFYYMTQGIYRLVDKVRARKHVKEEAIAI
jgi:hypothetical protein